MNKRIIRVGIQSYGDIKSRTIAIASGAHKPSAGEPKVWFVSLKSFASVLSEENAALLAVIRRTRPASLKELERSTGRAQSNLSRTLRTMEKYGLVRLAEGKGSRGRKPLRPEVLADRIVLELAV
ncbi:MAG: MarR family transcriptional regulator [Lysobacter sp.]|nr:MarR family transcriptional regulator [Lysobacter sp.]